MSPCKSKKKKRNPSLTPAERRQLATAKRLSKQFHGDAYHVVELNSRERTMPRFAVVAGELTDMTYEPNPGSKRSNYKWQHESGDRGFGRSRSGNKPLLVVDPKTKRPAIVAHRSPMRFSSKRGFVG